MKDAIAPLVTGYADAKAGLTELTGASEDLLHVHAGLLIFVAAALLFRKKMRSPVPLLVVFALACLNELLDVLSGGSNDRFEPVVDIANTVFWPTVLFAIARRWR